MTEGGLPCVRPGGATPVAAEGDPRVPSAGGADLRAGGGDLTDFALVHAWMGDRYGNLVYRERPQLQPAVRAAGRITIARPSRWSSRRARPDASTCPESSSSASSTSGPDIEKRIERRTVRPRPATRERSEMALTREQMAARAAQELAGRRVRQPRHRVPTLVPNCVPEGVESCSRARTACSASVPTRPRARGPRPDQRRQGDRHALPGAAFFARRCRSR